MTQDQYNDLVNTVQQLTEKTDTLTDSIARVDTKVENTKYVTRLLDVNVQYPAENDVLVYDKTGKWKNAQYDEIGLQPGEGGESNVYVIGIGDDTSPTNENVYSAARTIEDWVSSKNDDIVEGSLTFNEGKTIYIDNIRSRDASEGTDLGNGFIYKIKSGGKSYIEIDDLAVRGAAMFNTLEIKKITSVGGNLIVSPASNNIIRVEETTQLYEDQYQPVYRCYFRNKDEKDGGDTEQIKTDFQVGDLAKIQQFNVAVGVNEGAKNRYYWGRVLGVGEDYIDLSKTDVDPSTNTQPAEGDALVQYGNKNNVKRQNVISITTYADNAPAIQMYQGINSYSTDGKAIIEMAYDTAQAQQQAYMNVYGRMYVGAKDKSSYMQFDPTENGGRGKVKIKAEVVFEGTDDVATEYIQNSVNSSVSSNNDTFAHQLGYSNYNDLVAKAEAEQTIISGGYIRTSLIRTNELFANVGNFVKELHVGLISGGNYHFNVSTTGKLEIKNNSNIVQFSVDETGYMVANAAKLNGQITSTSGSIGKFTINDAGLYTSDSSAKIELSSTKLTTVIKPEGIELTATSSADDEYAALKINNRTTYELSTAINAHGMLNILGNSLPSSGYYNNIVKSSPAIIIGTVPGYNLINANMGNSSIYLPTISQYETKGIDIKQISDTIFAFGYVKVIISHQTTGKGFLKSRDDSARLYDWNGQQINELDMSAGDSVELILFVNDDSGYSWQIISLMRSGN